MTPDSLFSHRPFMRLWVARLAGTTGNQMLMLALAWQMYELTGSAWDLGLVGLLQFLPALPLMLPAGHAIDRYNRARLLSACLAVQMMVATVLCAGSAGGQLSREWLFAVAVVLGALLFIYSVLVPRP